MSNGSMVISATAGRSSTSADNRNSVSSTAVTSAGSSPEAPVSRG